MPDNAPHFDDAGRLIAPKFDDVYFSAEDGLAETRHVFLQGNNLAERFAAMKPGTCFTIGETGFGTGLNFLAAWQLFEQHAPADARLEFVSVEGMPLDEETIGQALSAWPELERYRDSLLQQWGPLWPGMHRYRFAEGRVRLTLLVGEVADVLAEIDAAVDAWFLDGFAPSRNPAMWSDAVFSQLARLSMTATTLATYTAAGFVRRGLQAVGYDIEKQSGFGTKRDMTVGRVAQPTVQFEKGDGHACLPSDEGRSVVVIGGSLAGAFAARALAERGMQVTVIERQALVDGELPSLKPRVAVLQPKINDINDANGRWLREGYAIAIRLIESDPMIAKRSSWLRCGSFQTLPNNRNASRLRRVKSLERFVEQFAATTLCRRIEATQTADEVGLAMPYGGVIIDQAGVLRPAGLCAALLDHPAITFQENTEATSLHSDGEAWRVEQSEGEPLRADTVIIANALAATTFTQTQELILNPVRGQVTMLSSPSEAGPFAGVHRAVFWGGYLTPELGGVQMLGASFRPKETDLAWRQSEHEQVCDSLESAVWQKCQLPAIENPSGWVGLRVTTPNHRCYAEAIEPGLYVSLGHGSHGIASAAQAGEHLASLITGGVRARGPR